MLGFSLKQWDDTGRGLRTELTQCALCVNEMKIQFLCFGLFVFCAVTIGNIVDACFWIHLEN